MLSSSMNQKIEVKILLNFLESNHIKQIIKCDLGYEEGDSLIVLTKDPIKTYADCIIIFRDINGRYKQIYRYSDIYGYTCDYLVDGNLVGISHCLLSKWSKFSDMCFIVFSNMNGKIIPILSKLGGTFKIEFCDVNNDGLTDILITNLEWVKGIRQPTMTEIYLRSGNRFMLYKKISWKSRWKVAKR
jgi:hypothetical protein